MPILPTDPSQPYPHLDKDVIILCSTVHILDIYGWGSCCYIWNMDSYTRVQHNRLNKTLSRVTYVVSWCMLI